MRWWVRLVVGASLLWASWLLATLKPSAHTHWRGVAALVVGAAAAVQLLIALSDRLGLHRRRAHSQADTFIRQHLVALYRSGELTGDFTTLSLHAWEVPAWYRTLFPYRLRRRLRQWTGDSLQRHALRPTLQLAARQRVEPQSGSDIGFRKGIGLVGLCVQENERDAALYVDFETAEYRTALASLESWENASLLLTRGLEFADAIELSHRYGQAVAIVIRDQNEAIGCVTLEVPPRSADNLLECPQALDTLAAAARELSIILSAHPSTESMRA